MFRVSALAILVFGVLCPSASAAAISVVDGMLTYTAAAGERNRPTIEPLDADSVRVSDEVQLSEGEGCAQSLDTDSFPEVRVVLRCSGINRGAVITLGDEDDHAIVTLPSALPALVEGQLGADLLESVQSPSADRLIGGPGDDALYGGVGNDVLDGGEGNDVLLGLDPTPENRRFQPEVDQDDDVLDGGEGDDLLQGGPGSDHLNGGPGSDRADYSASTQPVTISSDGRADGGPFANVDILSADVEILLTGSAADTIAAGPKVQAVESGAGDDLITTGGVEAQVEAGSGDDRIDARDGAVTRVACGEGTDAAELDSFDDATADCEQLDRSAARSSLLVPRRLELRARLAGRVLVIRGRLVFPDRPQTGSCQGKKVMIRLRGAGRRVVRARLSRSCRFNRKVALGRHARRVIEVRASFAGDSEIKSRTSRWIRVRRHRAN